MTTIEVFEPALCCNTGVCGPELDQELVDFTAALTGGIGIVVPIISFIVTVLASIGLLFAVSHRARVWLIVCLAAFGVVIMFMTQQAVGIRQTPYEQRQEVCKSRAAEFPADCQ